MIKFINVNKFYKTKSLNYHALNNISFQINKGDFISILGKSGSGKTTLLNCIGCLDRFNSGNYYFNNSLVNSLTNLQLSKFRNKKIGFVFQSFNLIDNLTAFENIELPLGYLGVSKKIRKKRVDKLLDIVKVLDGDKKRPNEYSGGQQQRIAIARAIANNPDLLIADEPTGNLDSQSAMEIMELFKSLNEIGMTIIMVTHDLDMAKYATKKILIEDGKII